MGYLQKNLHILGWDVSGRFVNRPFRERIATGNEDCALECAKGRFPVLNRQNWYKLGLFCTIYALGGIAIENRV